MLRLCFACFDFTTFMLNMEYDRHSRRVKIKPWLSKSQKESKHTIPTACSSLEEGVKLLDFQCSRRTMMSWGRSLFCRVGLRVMWVTKHLREPLGGLTVCQLQLGHHFPYLLEGENEREKKFDQVCVL